MSTSEEYITNDEDNRMLEGMEAEVVASLDDVVFVAETVMDGDLKGYDVVVEKQLDKPYASEAVPDLLYPPESERLPLNMREMKPIKHTTVKEKQ